MNTYIYPDTNSSELKKNYMWKKYYSPLLNQRGNWRQLPYNTPITDIDLVYSPTPKLNRGGKITGSIYDMVNIVSDKTVMNNKLLQGKTQKYLPIMYFLNSLSIRKIDINNINKLLNDTSTFYYLKNPSGSIGHGLYIVKSFDDIKDILSKNPAITSWLLSENIPSYLYKRVGSYQPNGLIYNENIGHVGRLKYFILFKIDSSEKSVYMYNKSIYEIAPEEFTKDSKDLGQNLVIGLGPSLRRSLKNNYSKNYNIDPDFAFDPVTVFGDKYFSIILPQLSKITSEIFKVTNNELNCKNSLLYNDGFRSCFHFASVDIIITPQLKCYFLEINTRPSMDRPLYQSIMNYPSMIDGVIQITIDPYFPPKINPGYHLTWDKISEIKMVKNKNTFYVSPTLKLSKEIKKLFQLRKKWEEVIYPKFILPKHSIDFLAKRELKDPSNDILFKKGLIINKIHTINNYMGNKKTMYDILSHEPKALPFLPLTVTFNIDDDYETLVERAMVHSQTWILKPSVGLQGTGIYISNNYNKIIEYIKLTTGYSEWVLSQYIDNPYLLKLSKTGHGVKFNDKIGRKTHIRLYVLITKIKGKSHIYLYKHNLIFCAVQEYKKNDLTNIYSNLTNLYVASKYYNEVLNINGSDAYKDLSLPFETTIKTRYGEKFYKNKIFSQIQSMLEIILGQFKIYLKCNNSKTTDNKGCFQYIALDVMPDKDFNLFLLEINSRPGMNAPLYHWGDLSNFSNSLLKKTIDVENNNKTNISNKEDGFIFIK